MFSTVPCRPRSETGWSCIKDAGKSLLAIINDILDVSKIDAGKLELERIAISPSNVVDGAIAIVRDAALSKGLELQKDLATDLPAWIEGDSTRLRQILLNLLSNAVKFTADGSVSVAVSSSFEPDSGVKQLRFAVTDSGIGVAPDRLHLLFQNFSQVDRSTTRRFGGTGLGLAICKRLAEAMGGAIGVESALGRGSTFWFTIALTEVLPPVTAEDVAPATARVGVSILVADDIVMNQLVVSGLLTAAGHQVTIVGDGAAAFEAVQARDYDLVLMDMEMPVMDGLRATGAIRRLGERVRDIPIIALTANAMPDEIARCYDAGMNDHLAKPIDRAALLAAVAKWSGEALTPHSAISPVAQIAVIDDETLRELERILGKPKVAELSVSFRSQLRSRSRHHIDDGPGATGVGSARPGIFFRQPRLPGIVKLRPRTNGRTERDQNRPGATHCRRCRCREPCAGGDERAIPALVCGVAGNGSKTLTAIR